MAGSPAANRTAVANVILESAPVVLSGTTAILAQNADFLGSVFIPRRIVYTVVAAVTVAGGSVVVSWRPTVAATTGNRHIVTFTVPVSAIDTMGIVDLNYNPSSEVVIGAGSPTSAYGISGSGSFAGLDTDNLIMGPGGQIAFTPGGESDAGSISAWMEVELLGNAGEKQTNAIVNVTPTLVGV